MTSGPTIDYEALHQDAMRGVVKSVLKETERSGLPGEHHFYISFNTRAPGIILSRRLKEKYPHEMTIVLQHRFWGLAVTEDRFEVNLTFDGIPERLVVPFQAIRVFVDPSVRYGLQFEIGDIGPDPRPAIDLPDLDAAINAAAAQETGDQQNSPAPQKKPRSAKRAKPAGERALAAERNNKREPSTEEAVQPVEEAAAQAAGGPANVVSLDAFRKR